MFESKTQYKNSKINCAHRESTVCTVQNRIYDFVSGYINDLLIFYNVILDI